MAEKEYIERDTIYRRVKERINPYGKPTIDYESGVKVLNLIKQEPAADVVAVVRCKDCAFAKNNYLVNGLCLCEKTIHDYIKGEIPRNTLMCEDDFCSYGERKDDNG